MNNLLSDPMISIATTTGTKKASLPQVLAWLSDGSLVAFPALRAHQEDVWHVFLVQLAASIIARSPGRDPENPPTDPQFWQEGLLALAKDKTTAWQLVVGNLLNPAFFQHPLAMVEDIHNFKPRFQTPDELDVLVTAKNHDLKKARIDPQDVEAWVYALVCYQTTSGFLGRGNYGIIRMNGGFASRPIVALVRSRQPSARFREELPVVCRLRRRAIEAFGYQTDGPVLTWLEPWTRKSHQYHFTDLDPLFIETPRALRLQRNEKGGVAGFAAPSEARQIGPENVENGDVGDPWIPINVENKKGRAALALGGNGWTAERVCKLLFEQGFELTELQRPRLSPQALWFVGSALVRGQGKTEGFHRCAVPIPPRALTWLTGSEKEALANRAQSFLKLAREVEQALRKALTALLKGGPSDPDDGGEALTPWISGTCEAFSRQWQSRFFDQLWGTLDLPEEGAVRAWAQAIVPQAEDLLAATPSQLPVPQARKYRAQVASERIFWGMLWKKGIAQQLRPESLEEVEP